MYFGVRRGFVFLRGRLQDCNAPDPPIVLVFVLDLLVFLLSFSDIPFFCVFANLFQGFQRFRELKNLAFGVVSLAFFSQKKKARVEGSDCRCDVVVHAGPAPRQASMISLLASRPLGMHIMRSSIYIDASKATPSQ